MDHRQTLSGHDGFETNSLTPISRSYNFTELFGLDPGGVKRNDTGKQAEIKFGEYLLTRMQTKYQSFGVSYLQRRINNFMNLLGTDTKVLLESGLSALQWPGRLLAFNMQCPFVGSRGNNVDMILLRTPQDNLLTH